MIYLDNAATSHPKPESVYRAVDHVLRNISANPGRSGHKMAAAADRIIFNARESIARLFGIEESDRIIFTANATGALNLAIQGLLKPGDHCVTTNMEHNSVVRPLHALLQSGVGVDKIPASPEGALDPRLFARAINLRTKLVVITHASNVIGAITPVAEIVRIAHTAGIPVLLDAAQTAGAVPINVKDLGIDLLACPGHKSLLGPQGTGLLYIAPSVALKPVLYGGSGSRSDNKEMPDFLPDRYEPGTLNTPGIAGLGAGAEFLIETGVENVRTHEVALSRALMEGLAAIPGVTVCGPADPEARSSVVLFTVDDVDPAEIGDRLDSEFEIAARVGLHCAPDAHRTIGTYPIGGVRLSPGYFNTANDIQRTVEAVRVISARRVQSGLTRRSA